jgi:hypothetical protein
MTRAYQSIMLTRYIAHLIALRGFNPSTTLIFIVSYWVNYAVAYPSYSLLAL